MGLLNVRKFGYQKTVIIMRGDETRLEYVQYIQGILPNVPAHTTFIDVFVMTMTQLECRMMNVFFNLFLMMAASVVSIDLFFSCFVRFRTMEYVRTY